MKAKLYTISILASIAFGVTANAQCTVAITSLTVNGMTVNASATGSGASVPLYGWSWGDTQTSTGQSASHTYSSAGAYYVCVGYTDVTNSNCVATDCDSVLITAVGIAENTPVQAEVKTSPNPFTETANISLTLNQATDVEISVYDITGKQVAVIQKGQLGAGAHLITWTPAGLSDGIYFLQVKAGDSVQTKKIVHTTK